MRDLYILRGIPGCGKSELAETLADNFAMAGLKVIIACADDFFITEEGDYEFDASRLGEAHNLCKLTVETAMDANFDAIFVSNTSTTQKELNPYLEMAKAYDYRVISLVVENRHGNSNIHEVPENSLKRMENRFSVKLR